MAARSITWLVAMLVILSGAPADAQEKGQVGVTMGYPATVGIIWHVAERFAVRPEIWVSRNSQTTVSTRTVSFGNQNQTMRSESSSDSTNVGVGVSVLVYLWKSASLSAFVRPGYAYSHGTITGSTSDSRVVVPGDYSTTEHSGSGSFGAQYALGRRFGVFGEVGVEYSRGRLTLPSLDVETPPGSPIGFSSETENTSRGVNTRGAVGVILYFR